MYLDSILMTSNVLANQEFSTSSPGRFSLALEVGQAFSRPTSEAREKHPGDKVEEFWV